MFYNGQQDESIVPSISSENIQNNCKTVCWTVHINLKLNIDKSQQSLNIT